jgi:predicted AAA+ superfamily ATPase
LHAASAGFPVLLVTGPRQVGKTTLLQMCAQPPGGDTSAATRRYVTLDDLEARELARRDPALFLQTWAPPVLIDEVQYAPQLFPAIKLHVDRHRRNGDFWLTGSQKFHLMQGVTESLAGRVAILDLLSLSRTEADGLGPNSQPFLPTADWLEGARHRATPMTPQRLYERIWLGGFPRLFEQGPQARDLFFRSYVQTYLQRDVPELLKVTDLLAFNRFLTATAARTGQLLNIASIARDVDIDHKTARAWLSVLEASGLVYLLQPYHTNLAKRLVKAPKLYFLDTGLAAWLSRWPDAASLEAGSLSGAILETWAVAEVLKSWWHAGREAFVHFYRDVDQQEVDLLVEQGDTLHPVEIKKTASPSLHARRHFRVLEKLGRPIGPGAVLCLVERDVPLSAQVTAVPMSYL